MMTKRLTQVTLKPAAHPSVCDYLSGMVNLHSHFHLLQLIRVIASSLISPSAIKPPVAMVHCLVDTLQDAHANAPCGAPGGKGGLTHGRVRCASATEGERANAGGGGGVDLVAS